MIIRTLIVDDEPLALSSLENLLAHVDDVDIVAACSNGPDAISAIRNHQPDLIFLDIQMPGMTGLEVAKAIKDEGPPLIIFVTAYNHFAVDAFEIHALDYVLKPYVDERLMAALGRAREHLNNNRSQSMSGRLENLLADLEPRLAQKQYPTRFVIKEPGRALIVMVEEIHWIGSAANYVELHTEDRCYLHRLSMDAIENQLDPKRFLRIHRSTIVCLNQIAEIATPDRTRTLVKLKDGTELKAAISTRERLRHALEEL